jgi:CRP-like cAMP-binding protein
VDEGELFARFGRVVEAGTVLFREGDRGDEMYVIQSGEIAISRRLRDRDTVIAMLSGGEFFGEMAIVNNRPRSATATVQREARVLVIDGKRFEAMLRGKVEIAVRLIKTLAERLEQANLQIELLLLEDRNHRVVQCLRHMAEAQAQELGPDRGQSAVFIPVTLAALAARVALPIAEVADVLARLGDAGLVLTAPAAQLGEGYVVPEVGRLLEFLEFLQMKDRRRA